MATLRRLRRARVLIVVLLLAVVALAAAWFALPAWLAQQVGERLGGQVTLSLAPLFSPRPGVEGRALAWQAPAGRPGRIAVARLRVETDWRAREGRRPLEIHLSGVHIELHQDADGAWVLPGAAAPAGGAPADSTGFMLTGVSIEAAQLRLVPRDGAPVTVAVGSARLEADGAAWRLNATLDLAQGAHAVQGKLVGRLRQDGAGVEARSVQFDGAGRSGAVAIDALQLALERLRWAPDAALTAQGVRLAARLGHPEAGPWALAALLPELTAAAGQLEAGLARIEARQDGAAPVLLVLQDTQLAVTPAALRLAPLRGLALRGAPAQAWRLEADGGELVFDRAEGRVRLRDGRATLTLPDPAREGRRVAVSLSLSGAGRPAAGQADGVLEAQAENSRLSARWQLDAAVAPSLAVEARVDRLDLDRWLAPGGDAGGPAPLDAWRDWPLQGTLRVGALRWRGVTLEGAQLRLGAAGQ
jgi:hypothetical protein